MAQAVVSNIQILTLPDSNSFLTGYYGLETCFIRGIVRLDFTPLFATGSQKSQQSNVLNIRKLTVALKADTQVKFLNHNDPLDSLSRSRKLYDIEEILLVDLLEFNTPLTFLEIPFELLLPETVRDPLSTPLQISNRLNQPSYSFQAFQSLASTNVLYSAKTTYLIVAEVLVPSVPLFMGLKTRPSKLSANVGLSPWIVFDPKFIPRIVFPDGKKWRSAPDSSPLEYDVDVSAIVLGPNDTFKLSYRLAVSRPAARDGVRIKYIRFVLREHHYVGDTRGHYVRGVKEILNWSQFEGPAAIDDDEVLELSTVKTTGKAGILRSNNGMLAVGDGLYAENHVDIQIPKRGAFTPTVNKILDPLRNNISPTPSQVEIKHSMQIIIELSNRFESDADEYPNVKLECGCVLTCCGMEDLSSIMEDFPEIMPKLDYEKVTGGEAYIPKYDEFDPLIRELKEREEEEERAKIRNRQESLRRHFWSIWNEKKRAINGLADADNNSAVSDLEPCSDLDESDVDTLDLELEFGILIPDSQIPQTAPPFYYSNSPEKSASLKLQREATQDLPEITSSDDEEMNVFAQIMVEHTPIISSVPHPLESMESPKSPIPLPPNFPFNYPVSEETSKTAETSKSKGKQRATEQFNESLQSSQVHQITDLVTVTLQPQFRRSTATSVFDNTTRNAIEEDISIALTDSIIDLETIPKQLQTVYSQPSLGTIASHEEFVESDNGGSEPIFTSLSTPNTLLQSDIQIETEKEGIQSENTNFVKVSESKSRVLLENERLMLLTEKRIQERAAAEKSKLMYVEVVENAITLVPVDGSAAFDPLGAILF
ncbi:hypothetical protein HK096_008025 [Nowakowskiella sp. JEL0078]|nr:hypothetical protein HK096_008025 [Nowakowskiella sp. JEL0078]